MDLGINKKMKTPFIIFLAIIFQILFVSCAKPDNNPPITFDNNHVNQQILLRAPELINSFETTRPVALEVTCISNNEIVFPNHFNLKIFRKTDENWIEIQEIPTTRLPPDDIVFSPLNGNSAIEILVFSPDLGNYEKAYELRVYVIGDMKTEEGVEEVAAFADVKLHPPKQQ